MKKENFDPNMINLFKEESAKHILIINNLLLKIEKEGFNKETFDGMKREAHTLKGDSRMMGFIQISEAAHKVEDIFELFKSDEKKFNLKIIENIFKALDLIQDAINKLPDQINIDIQSIMMLDGDAIEKNKIEKKIEIKDEKIDIFIDNIEEKIKSEYKEPLKKVEKDIDYININLKKINDLINLFSAFPRYTNRFTYLINKLRTVRNDIAEKINDDEIKSLDSVIYDFAHEITFYDLISKEFQNEITKIKLVPLSNIFDLFPRLVRDIAINTKKEINFVMNGRNIELDKGIVDKLKEILIHLINNAVDHGCENTDERIKLGKSKEGNVILSAYNKGDNVLIEVTDDGRGIDIDKVKKKAVERNMITRDKVDNISNEDILKFIFEGGFSTKKVSKYSGRGIGMDVVANIVNELNGEIKVNTWDKKGTTFIISLPLFSSFIPVTIFQLGDRVIGIPSAFVMTAMRANSIDIKKIGENNNLIEVDNMEVSLINLKNLFGISDDLNNTKHKNIIIIKYQDEIAGLEVTDIILEKKMVIKKVTGISEKFKFIIGAVLLGNEKAIPVLNIPELFKILKEETFNITKMIKKNDSKKIWAKNVLLVEDSIITRENEKKILLDNNLNVFEASNGKEAIKHLDNQKFDVIITDIEMPVMDGLELIKYIKADNNMANIPIIVISSYKDYVDKLLNLGVKYFINKSDFSTQSFVKLLKIIELI